MRTIDIPELKDHLATYLDYAKAGEEIIIRDKKQFVARLVPIPYIPEDASDEDRMLVAAGIMTLPKKSRDTDAFDKLPMAQLSGDFVGTNAATQAIVDERDESW